MMQTGPQGEMSRFMEHVQNRKGSPRPDRHGAVVLLWIALSALGGCSDRAETEHHTSGTSEASERSSALAPQSPKPTKTEAAEAEPSADAPAATATPTAIEVPSPPSQNARQFRRRYRRPYTDADGRIALGLILDASFADGEMVPGFLLNDLDTIEPTSSPLDVPPGPVSGDFDGDGTLDAAPGPMLSTVIADFNGDGCDDLLGPMLFTSTEPPTLRMGSPTGLGEALPWNGPQLQSPAVGDFDDDGLEDLVGFAGGDAPTRTLSIFFGTAEGLPTRPDVVRTYRTERPFPMVWSLYAPGGDRILVSPRYLDVKLLNLLEEGGATRIEEFPLTVDAEECRPLDLDNDGADELLCVGDGNYEIHRFQGNTSRRTRLPLQLPRPELSDAFVLDRGTEHTTVVPVLNLEDDCILVFDALSITDTALWSTTQFRFRRRLTCMSAQEMEREVEQHLTNESPPSTTSNEAHPEADERPEVSGEGTPSNLDPRQQARPPKPQSRPAPGTPQR